MLVVVHTNRRMCISSRGSSVRSSRGIFVCGCRSRIRSRGSGGRIRIRVIRRIVNVHSRARAVAFRSMCSSRRISSRPSRRNIRIMKSVGSARRCSIRVSRSCVRLIIKKQTYDHTSSCDCAHTSW